MPSSNTHFFQIGSPPQSGQFGQQFNPAHVPHQQQWPQQGGQFAPQHHVQMGPPPQPMQQPGPSRGVSPNDMQQPGPSRRVSPSDGQQHQGFMMGQHHGAHLQSPPGMPQHSPARWAQQGQMHQHPQSRWSPPGFQQPQQAAYSPAQHMGYASPGALVADGFNAQFPGPSMPPIVGSFNFKDW